MSGLKYSAIEWESLCERCGRCCYEKYEYRGQFFYTETPCEFLDRQTRHCRVYHERQDKQPECECLTPELVQSGVLPDDCPYVTMLNSNRRDRALLKRN
jgi:uncharacterized cysteine cluster protein YcgN (CxxCxxCC family)